MKVEKEVAQRFHGSKGKSPDDSEYVKGYKDENFEKIVSPFCNFGDFYDTVESYKNILRFSIGNYTPWKIKI